MTKANAVSCAIHYVLYTNQKSSKAVDLDIEALNDDDFETVPHVSITSYHSFGQSLIPGAVLVFDR